METRNSPSISELHKMAQETSITNYEGKSKSKIFDEIQRKCSVQRLRRVMSRRRTAEREAVSRDAKKRRKSISSLSSRLSKKEVSTAFQPEAHPKAKKSRNCYPMKSEPLNEIDPIMLTPILKTNVFKFHRPNGTIIQFNVESLVDFMLVSGDFHEPETRIAFTDENLKEIDKMAVEAGLNRGSVYAAKYNTSARAEVQNRQDALLAIERCAGEVVTEMLRIAETADPEEAQLELAMQEFPIFDDYFSQMRAADKEYASKCVSHWVLFLRGPPNRPNSDPYGLIRMISSFVSRCNTSPSIYSQQS